MKNELLGIADYIESLEQRLAALEARTIELECKVSELEANQKVQCPADCSMSSKFQVQEESIDSAKQVDEQLEQEVKMATLEARLIELEAKTEEQPAAPSTAINAPKVDDLRRAISLGDRFLFQRELFNQNGELMQKTLEALEKKTNLDEAVAYLDKHFAEWDKESNTYQLFLSLLKRRF